jgi:hypothetical protein
MTPGTTAGSFVSINFPSRVPPFRIGPTLSDGAGGVNLTEIKIHRTPRWQIALAWIIVLIPFVWGIVNTLRSSLALMRR